MTAAAVRTRSAIPSPRTAVDSLLPAPGEEPTGPAVGYQRVLHQLVRRELRMLAELAGWAPADEAGRTAVLTGHADLIGRVLLHHHRAEREAVWPALRRNVPAELDGRLRAAVEDWAATCARIDSMLRDVATAARQWAVAATVPARDRFAAACRSLADAVDAQTAEEERTVLPLLEVHLHADDWAAIARTARCRLTGFEQLLVLGLALEDACAADRARLLGGLSPVTRAAWRLYGGRQFRAAVVRLRGAPPAV
ncbi:MAG: uncharacterized protein JWQ99_1670 [Blastococcus sp.]|nr:uncharacterized protein [Blastococcus sp.]